ncbi:hypothetical protein LOK49_LG08G03314 [Camellia lanceoleosa]|uniref:Uncharacterized protein n=1 Tax=Camellia lanceoleosa TaxID=1840588 RepID=A0ACC0GLX2_9ERIC|nr:hypothetical protein LOK49_LG08G03314 [Camellia lanceoleosa]
MKRLTKTGELWFASTSVTTIKHGLIFLITLIKDSSQSGLASMDLNEYLAMIATVSSGSRSNRSSLRSSMSETITTLKEKGKFLDWAKLINCLPVSSIVDFELVPTVVILRSSRGHSDRPARAHIKTAHCTPFLSRSIKWTLLASATLSMIACIPGNRKT